LEETKTAEWMLFDFGVIVPIL